MRQLQTFSLNENSSYKKELHSDNHGYTMQLFRVVFPAGKELFVLYDKKTALKKYELSDDEVLRVVGQAAMQFPKELQEKMEKSYLFVEAVPVGLQGWGGCTF